MSQKETTYIFTPLQFKEVLDQFAALVKNKVYKKFDYLKKVNDRFANKKQSTRKVKPKKFTRNYTLKKDTSIIISHNLKTKNIKVTGTEKGKAITIKSKVIDGNNCGKLELITNKKLFKMIDILVETLSSYRKTGAPRVLFEIACLKMCGLENTEEKIVYKEVVKVKEVEATPIKEPNKEVTNEIKEEKVEQKPVINVEEKPEKTEKIVQNTEKTWEKSDVSRETQVNVAFWTSQTAKNLQKSRKNPCKIS